MTQGPGVNIFTSMKGQKDVPHSRIISTFCPGTLPLSSVNSPRMVPVTRRSTNGLRGRRRPSTRTTSLAFMAVQAVGSAAPSTTSRASSRQESRPHAPQSRPGREKARLSANVANSATDPALRTPSRSPVPQAARASPFASMVSSSPEPSATNRGSQVRDFPPSTRTMSAPRRGRISCNWRAEFQSRVVVLGPMPATLTHSCAKRAVSVPSRSSP